MSEVQKAIRAHGARVVYQAAISRMSGDGGAALAAVGLVAQDLAQANKIMTAAFKQMGAADRAVDKASAQAKLTSRHG